jgi:hypothetical protein
MLEIMAESSLGKFGCGIKNLAARKVGKYSLATLHATENWVHYSIPGCGSQFLPAKDSPNSAFHSLEGT